MPFERRMKVGRSMTTRVSVRSALMNKANGGCLSCFSQLKRSSQPRARVLHSISSSRPQTSTMRSPVKPSTAPDRGVRLAGTPSARRASTQARSKRSPFWRLGLGIGALLRAFSNDPVQFADEPFQGVLDLDIAHTSRDVALDIHVVRVRSNLDSQDGLFHI